MFAPSLSLGLQALGEAVDAAAHLGPLEGLCVHGVEVPFCVVGVQGLTGQDRSRDLGLAPLRPPAGWSPPLWFRQS